MATATRVTCRWDDQIGAAPGWYYEAMDDDGRTIEDSQKIWVPIDADQFGRADRSDLRDALASAYPGTEIEMI